jgi:glycerol-3-phosphate dehydrogenase
VRNTASLSDQNFDLLVIGGGITGACAALDAAQRGLSVALVEQGDFAGATSAQSLKMIHGGIRYLQHLDLVRLRESCRERMMFLRAAPHLTRPLPIVVPTFGHGMQGKFVFRVALFLNHILTIDRNNGIGDSKRQIPAGHMMSRKQVMDDYPYVDTKALTGAACFYDGQILNPPRLIWSIVRSAIEAGAVACNYCDVKSLVSENGRVVGASIDDVVSGETISLRAKAVVNATGPFAQSLVGSASSATPANVPLSRDMAFVVKRSISEKTAIGVQTKFKDPDALLSRGNRHLFLAPWRGYTLVGVNSRVFPEDPYSLDVTEKEIATFIEEVNEAIPTLNLKRDDIGVVYGGLLPFGENAENSTDLSFGKRSIVIDHGDGDDGLPGLFSAMSVRWTMGRQTAERVIDAAEKYLRGSSTECNTHRTSVFGGDFESLGALKEEVKNDDVGRELEPAIQEHLVQNYGTAWRGPLELARHDSSLMQRVSPEPIIGAEIAYAIKSEMAMSLSDCVLRRTDVGTGEEPADETLTACAKIAAKVLGWDSSRVEAEIESVKASYPFFGKVNGVAKNTDEKKSDA